MDGCARTIEWLRDRVTVSGIRQICQGDYGRDVEEHFSGIMDILGRGAWVNGAPPWCPREVLELERWMEPRSPEEHLSRFFACALLTACMGYERKDGFFLEGGIETLWRLADSAIALGGQAPELALEMLSWFAAEERGPMVDPFARFCVARLKRHLRVEEPVRLKAWVDEAEAKARAELGATGRWLSGISEHAKGRERRHHWVWE